MNFSSFPKLVSLSACLIWMCACASNDGWQADVPVPSTTPFDSDQMARTAYLEGYRTGYRAQMSPSSGIELTSGPNLQARRLGFEAGAAQARAGLPPETPPASQVIQ
ncbi:MAG TPA: hypothetical protein VM735_11745 [Candidatus Kapabacteria bacterium]|nr:hypothetical protein [Candidatus Kapabacteria bacterium]